MAAVVNGKYLQKSSQFLESTLQALCNPSHQDRDGVDRCYLIKQDIIVIFSILCKLGNVPSPNILDVGQTSDQITQNVVIDRHNQITD